MDDILMTEYSEAFDKERKARIKVSYFKYGPAKKNFAEGRVDALATAERCIDAFKKDHNSDAWRVFQTDGFEWFGGDCRNPHKHGVIIFWR